MLPNTPSNNSSSGLRTLFIALVVIGVIACVFVVGIAVAITLATGSFSPEAGIAVGLTSVATIASGFLGCVPFLLVFGLLGGYIYYYQRARAKVGKPQLILPSSLRVGESFTVQYQHTFNQAISCDLFAVQLIFQEQATYSQGTDTRTVTNDQVVAETTRPQQQYQAGDMIMDTLQWQIPHDAMHTLKAPRNVLRWLVRIKFIIPKMPDYLDDYEILVLPEILGR